MTRSVMPSSIQFFIHRHTGFDILVTHDTGHFGQDRNRIGVPLHEDFVLGNLLAVLVADNGAGRNRVAFEFAACLIVDRKFAVTVQHDNFVCFRHNGFQIVVLQLAAIAGAKIGLFDHAGRRTADMECPHG